MATPEYLGSGLPDGVNLGRATTDKIGFYGLATPIVQPSVTNIGTTTISQVATSGKWAFASSTAALAFVSRVQSLQDKLAALGLVAVS
jgi:hypothetical protein